MKTSRLILSVLLFHLFCAFTIAGAVPADIRLQRKATEAERDTALVNNFARQGFSVLSKPDLVQAYIDSAMLICEKKNLEIPSLLHLLKAEYHYSTGDFRTASEEASEALKKSAASGDLKVLARTNIFLGKYYHLTKFYKESLEYYDNSIEISRKEKLKGMIPKVLLAKASVFRSIGDLSGYSRNLQAAIDEAFTEGDSVLAAEGYSKLGTLYCGEFDTSAVRDFRKADSLLKQSVRISRATGDLYRTGYSLANTGWNFYLEKMYDSALYYYEKSLKTSLPGKNYSGAANSLGNIGTIYRDLGEPAKAIRYYSKAIEQGEQGNDVYNLRWIYEDMSKLYLLEHDTSNAFRSYVLYKKYNDIYITGENTKGLEDAKLRYETDTRNKEVELLSLRLKTNRVLNYGFAVLIIMIVVIGLLLLRSARLKDKRRISEMNRQISEITQANLRQQMNPHFIFNTLNSIQYYMYQHDKLATNNYLTKFSNLMRKVLDNSRHTYVPLSDDLGALKLYLELECIRFKEKFEFKINVDEEIDPLMYKVPTMLLQPYVENSINHGLVPMEGKGFVEIDIKLKKDHLLCSIEDNGIGREASRERNGRKESVHNSLGTEIAASRLDLVNALYGSSLKTIYTDLKNGKGEAVGTRVEIHIPIIS